MKNKIFKPLFLALLLPVLAGCSILESTIANVALNFVFDSELLLNHASLKDGEFDVSQYSTLPTTEATRAELTYGVEALAMPKHLAVSQMNVNVEIDFTFTFSEGAEALFYIENMSSADASEETPAEATIQILYPVGTLAKPTSFDEIQDWMNIENLLDLKKEASKDVSITITGKAKDKTKSRTFYFNLNSDGITLPGGPDVEIDPDLALVVTEANKEGTLDLTLTPTELVDGKTFTLQVIWVDLTFAPSQTGIATVTIKNLATLSEKYDLTIPEINTVELSSNDSIGSYIFTIRLKTEEPAPTTPLVVTASAIVVPN